MARQDFATATRHVIAARAGYRCSYPGCGRLTVGPGHAADTFDDTGKAAHIHAASPNGPRGQGGLSASALSAATNGIWMCSDHADLIDKKKGVRFPVSTLLGWKALHEHRTSYEHSGRSAAFGFVRSLTVQASNLFRAGETIELAKTTFLVGQNGTGKTALCEWLTALDAPGRLSRWRAGHPHRFAIGFEAPGPHTLEVLAGQGDVALVLDGTPVSVNHARATIVYLRDRGEARISCHLRRLDALLGLDEVALKALLRLATSATFTSLRFEPYVPDNGEELRDGDEDRMVLKLALPDGRDTDFESLSGGEQGMLLLDLAIAHARSASRFAPTLLLLELKSLGIDWPAFQPYLDLLASSQCAFQTVVTSWELPSSVATLGWQIFDLSLPAGTSLRTIEPRDHST